MRSTSDHPSLPESLEAWLPEESARAAALLLQNVSPPGALPGFIMASPSRSGPDYDYHWVRDSGIAVRALLSLYQSSGARAERRRYLDLLLSFVSFSRHIQQTAVQHGTGLGEPKFTPDGEPYQGPWGRPQNDGPAIRAIELTRLAFALLDEGEGALVRERLYDARLPADSVIKTDLEYVARHWSEPCIGPWEELRGRHFFAQLLSRRALAEGSALATRLGDTGAARFYLEQSRLMEPELRRYWDPEKGYIVSTRDAERGPCGVRSGMDSAVVLATLGGYCLDDLVHEEEPYPVHDAQVLATIAVLERVFAALYPINDPARNLPGIAVGRYPEDRYDGYRTDALGNPWSGITIGFAMFYYKLVMRYRKLRRIAATTTSAPFFQRLPASGGDLFPQDPGFGEALAALGRRGDTFLQRVRCHVGADGSMAEQINRVTGFQQGAADLTMNYAAFLLAEEARRTLRSVDPWPALYSRRRAPRAP
jgi:glucoamylase